LVAESLDWSRGVGFNEGAGYGAGTKPREHERGPLAIWILEL
jgi:hypothetical protein